MVVNFRTHGISRGARKLARTPTLIKKSVCLEKKINLLFLIFYDGFKIFILKIKILF
jgi:hypothetical protein